MAVVCLGGSIRWQEEVAKGQANGEGNSQVAAAAATFALLSEGARSKQMANMTHEAQRTSFSGFQCLVSHSLPLFSSAASNSERHSQRAAPRDPID